MKKINALIIGAGRAGTTSLSKIMEVHPEICFSNIKEVHYFCFDDLYKRGEKYYNSFFSHCKNEKVIASADTYLMPAYYAIKNIKKYNIDMKIIVMLRNPVDRAYSSYNYSVNYGYHNRYDKFTDSIEKEKYIENESDIIKLNNLGHFYCSLYYKHLEKWMSEFPFENFLFLTTKELKDTPEKMKLKLAEFLEISPFENNSPTDNKYNANAVPRNKLLEQFLLNRENPMRRIIRTIFPTMLKEIIINSKLIDRVHSINRKTSDYEPLDDKQRKISDEFFKDDLFNLKSKLGIEL